MRKRKLILINIMFLALFLLGSAVYEFDMRKFPEDASFLSKYSVIISNALLAAGCFYEVYFVKSKTRKKN